MLKKISCSEDFFKEFSKASKGSKSFEKSCKTKNELDTCDVLGQVLSSQSEGPVDQGIHFRMKIILRTVLVTFLFFREQFQIVAGLVSSEENASSFDKAPRMQLSVLLNS